MKTARGSRVTKGKGERGTSDCSVLSWLGETEEKQEILSEGDQHPCRNLNELLLEQKSGVGHSIHKYEGQSVITSQTEVKQL